MKCIKDLSTLLLARQWLLLQSNSTKIDSEFARLAAKCINDVDKELWRRLISNKTPWGVVESLSEFEEKEFEDEDFEKTMALMRHNDVNE